MENCRRISPSLLSPSLHQHTVAWRALARHCSLFARSCERTFVCVATEAPEAVGNEMGAVVVVVEEVDALDDDDKTSLAVWLLLRILDCKGC